MMRKCDGTDPHLRMPIDDTTGERVINVREHKGKYTYRPCDCGLRFDDVYRMVIWPHNEV